MSSPSSRRRLAAKSKPSKDTELKRPKEPVNPGETWISVARRLEVEITAGRFEEGARLPVEATLSRLLGVNRHTLRRAVQALVRKGLIRSVPHVGSFVAPPRIAIEVGPTWAAATSLAQHGMTHAHELLSERVCMPPASVARRLAVASRTEVIEIVQISTANGTPFSHVTTWLPADRFSRIRDLIETAGNVHAALAQLGIPAPRRKSVRITTRPATKSEVKLLDLTKNAGVLVIDSLNVDPWGEPTHVSHCIVDAARVELSVDF